MAELDLEESMSQKQDVLLTVYRICWDEMCWRRNAGYRTVILGLGYCGLILTVVACNPHMDLHAKKALAAVIALASVFGAGYLASNYQKYMSAAARMVAIEEYVGAFKSDFLGSLGALMPVSRKEMPQVPLVRNMVCIGSVVAFVAGGLITSGAILLM